VETASHKKTNISNGKLQNVVSAVVDWRLNTALVDMWNELTPAEWLITDVVSRHSLTVRSCVCWMTELSKTYAPLTVYFTAVAFLHVAYKISRTGFTDDLMEVLATISGQFVSTISLTIRDVRFYKFVHRHITVAVFV